MLHTHTHTLSKYIHTYIHTHTHTLSKAISFCAWSRASYAIFEISIIWAISFFFSCNSFASFALIWSNTTLSLRKLSISSRSCLLYASASLNLTSALSSLCVCMYVCMYVCMCVYVVYLFSQLLIVR